jgi:hypothetical protein
MTPEQLKQSIKEFKEIYQEEFGVELSDEEAALKAQGLLQLLELLTRGEQKVLQ